MGIRQVVAACLLAVVPPQKEEPESTKVKRQPVVSQPAQILGASQSQSWGSPLTSLSAEGLGGRG